ncbi:hypothetical protein Q4566_15760 [Tamlana sp. 2_MG-2023]|uniref:hypothetical protein n=1 Tax=unclassified Tamlana TaxID=2614803 RepID=UPI0026E1AB36|nr:MULTISPECIES: hypothetical protein [unclassified Tamlana]MDO6761663.1 hypothetical protein [Tamlana sp. 2_MG-2023]MDO6792489.1 hypothetical protein [Tamlana sp. 1_MG-2023]
MVDNKNLPIIVDTDGVNEIEIGSNSRVSVIKVGENKKLGVSKTTVDNHPVKWIWIATEFLDKAKEMVSGQVYDKWGEWKSKNATESIDKFGIGKQYVFANAIKTKTSQKDLTEGTIYYFEPFIDFPTLDRGNYIATVDTPKILSAYFARYKDEFKYPGESGTSNVYTYKNTIKLYVLGHMLPDYTVGYHNFALFEVDIWDTDGNKATKEPLKYFQKYHPDKFSINTMTELDFVIAEDWRDNTSHEKDTLKTYYAKIKTTIFFNEDTFTGEEVDDINDDYLITANENPRNNHKYLKFTNKFKSVAPNLDTIGIIYTSEDEAVSNSGWAKYLGRDTSKGKAHAKKYKKTIVEEFDTTKGKVLKEQQVSFNVKYDTMDVILDKYEAHKNNMLVVVGDVEYSSKNTEPCKFSKIEISHKSRKQPFVLFDENKTTPTVVDHTNLAFGIVAGEKKEKVTITAVGLAIQDYQDEGLKQPECYGITTAHKARKGRLERKKVKHKKEDDFKHNSIEDVFSMEKAYVLYPKGSLETSGSETLDIIGQQLQYTHKDNSVELEVGYLYNKTFDTTAQQWLGNTVGEWTNDLIDIAWIVRYFKLSDQLAQQYFVPISTCRYPNQRAIVNVFPDIEWWINFNYKAENPYHVYQTPNYKYRVITTEKNQNQKKVGKYRSTKKKTRDNSYKLEFEAGFKYNGKKIDFNSGNGFPLINAINFFLKAYEIFRKITFADETEEKENSVANGIAASSKGVLGKNMSKRYKQRKNKGFPFRIDVSRPSFSGGIYGSYKQSGCDVNTIAAMYEAKFAANPLFSIEGKLDLLFFAQFIGPIGQALDKISKVVKRVDYLTLGAIKIDYYLDLAAKVDLKVDVSGVNYHSVDGWGGGEVNANLPIKVWLEAGVNVDVNLQGIASADTDAAIRGEANMDLQITLDKRNNKLPMEFTFKGLDVKIWISLNAKSSSDNLGTKEKKPTDTPRRVPDAVKNLIAPGKPVKFTIL